MAKNKKTPAQKVSQLVSLVDNMINCEYTSKQLKTIRNQIKRLEKELNLPTQINETQKNVTVATTKICETEELDQKPTGNLCKILGWKENVAYQVSERKYKIANNVLYYYEPMLDMWQRNQGQLSKLQQFQEAKEITEIYHLYNEELKQYGYLNVVNFQKTTEYILFDGNKKLYGIKNTFNEFECNYLQNKYQIAKICDMIPVEEFN
jgi:predicted Zn-dependent protease with MMP-like domain